MTVLVLSGTSQARLMALELQDRGVPVVASLAGATRAPRAQGVTTRIGGFGGAEAFARYLLEEGIRAVLDATHPFASAMTHRTAQVCADMGIAHAIYQRPPWEPTPADRWVMLDDEADAAGLIEEGSVVFLATGRKTLERFASLKGCYLIMRQIDPPDRPFPYENGEYLIGTPPFSVSEEVELFEKRKVDWLVVKNAGGRASFSKLEAARILGMPVAMIRRPELPDALVFHETGEALAWAERAGRS